jgi:hypothetical protein
MRLLLLALLLTAPIVTRAAQAAEETATRSVLRAVAVPEITEGQRVGQSELRLSRRA